MLGTGKRQNQPVTLLLEFGTALHSCVRHRFLHFQVQTTQLDNFVSTSLKIRISLFRGVSVGDDPPLQSPDKEKDSKRLTWHSRLAHYEQKWKQLITT